MREHPYIDFCRLEKEMNMFELQVDSVYYWQLVRVYLMKYITKHEQTAINLSLKTPYLKRLAMNIVNAIRQKRLLSNMKETDILIARPHVAYPREKGIKEREFDFADIAKIYRTLDIYALGEYSKYNKNLFFDFSIPELSVIAWKIKRKVLGAKKTDSEDEKRIRLFLSKISRIYDCEIPYCIVEKQIQHEVQTFNRYKKYMKKILLRTKPKLILLSTYYDDHMYPLACAAGDLGITTVEIQHGLINSHEAYWYEDVSSLGKYLPDYLFTYGTWWNENIKMPDCTKAVAVGYPFLEAQINFEKKTEQFMLAVFSSPATGVVLSKFVVENIKTLLLNNVKVIYKLHPVEYMVWRREYPWLAECKEIQIIDDETNVYEILNHADMAIAVNSTVLYEAVSYPEMKIGVLKRENIERMMPLIECKAAAEIKDITDLLHCINSKSQKDQSHDSKIFFKHDAKKEIQNQIKQIIGL